MASKRAIRFHIRITVQQYLAYYRGHARQVVVRAHDGRNLRFPANGRLRVLTHQVRAGDFVLDYVELN